MNQESPSGAREGAESYARFLRAAHQPALARRTAQGNAAFFLPLLWQGARVLDAGCGPGSITLGLAEAVVPGPVTGVDIDPRTVALATEAATRAEAANVTFVEASVYELPFADASFDAVFAHALFQHLEEPAAALKELWRVLSPGGVMGVADADYDGSLIFPSGPELERAMAIQTAVRELGNGDPRIGRRLGSLLASAGFADVAVSASAMSEGTPDAAIRTAEASARYFEAAAFQERALAAGMAEHAEFAAAAAAWREWGAAPGACWVRFWIQATGFKPG